MDDGLWIWVMGGESNQRPRQLNVRYDRHITGVW